MNAQTQTKSPKTTVAPHQFVDTFNAPQSLEAEKAVIGSILISPNVFEEVSRHVQSPDFFYLKHRYIWDAIKNLHDNGMGIDYLSVATELQSTQKLDDVGGYPYLVQLSLDTPSSTNSVTYAMLVKRLAIKRDVMEGAINAHQVAMNDAVTTSQALEYFSNTARLIEMRLDEQAHEISLSEMLNRERLSLIERLEVATLNPKHVLGIKTGIKDLDRLLDGLRPGITTLAGATGMGKTALALTIALNASRDGIDTTVKRPAKVSIFSGEMTQEQLMRRLLSMQTGLPVRDIERASLNPAQLDILSNAMENLEAYHKLGLYSGKRINTKQIRDFVRSMVLRREIDMFIADGILQIDAVLDPDSKSAQYKLSQRRDIIEIVMNECEDISLSYGVPILLTHQMNRAPGNRSDNRPRLSDLAEASFIEQKSAVVLLLYRDAYYNHETDAPNGADIIVAKNRHGESGTVQAFYEAQFTRFVDAQRMHINLGDLG